MSYQNPCLHHRLQWWSRPKIMWLLRIPLRMMFGWIIHKHIPRSPIGTNYGTPTGVYARSHCGDTNESHRICSLFFFWIIDNSGSMQTQDGHKIITTTTTTTGNTNKLQFMTCSRWKEMVQTVDYHVNLAERHWHTHPRHFDYWIIQDDTFLGCFGNSTGIHRWIQRHFSNGTGATFTSVPP